MQVTSVSGSGNGLNDPCQSPITGGGQYPHTQTLPSQTSQCSGTILGQHTGIPGVCTLNKELRAKLTSRTGMGEGRARGKGILCQWGREIDDRVLWGSWPSQGSPAEVFLLQTPRCARAGLCKVNNNLLTLSLSLVSQPKPFDRESGRRTSTKSQNPKAEETNRPKLGQSSSGWSQLTATSSD